VNKKLIYKDQLIKTVYGKSAVYYENHTKPVTALWW
jgi:hypothetical protein